MQKKIKYTGLEVRKKRLRFIYSNRLKVANMKSLRTKLGTYPKQMVKSSKV